MTWKKANILIQGFSISDRAIFAICVGIALVAWFFVQLSQIQKTEISVVLTYEIPTNKILKNPPPQTLTAQLEGSGWKLLQRALNGQGQRLNFDLRQSDEEAFSYQDMEARLQEKLPHSTKIVSILPTMLELQLEELVEREVKVVLNRNIHPQTIPQYDLMNQIEIFPNVVTVRGPKSVVESIKTLTTENLTIKNLNKKNTFVVAVQSPKNTQVTVSPKEVSFNVLVEAVTEKTLDVPIRVFYNQSDSLVVLPSVGKVTCVVSMSQYEDLQHEDIELAVDATQHDFKRADFLPILLSKYPDFLNPKKISFRPSFVQVFRLESNVLEKINKAR